MTTKAPRFTCHIACWVTEQDADAIERIAEARRSTTSNIVREMIAICLNQMALPPRPARANGGHHAAADHP
jgi:hypothetical protein